MPTNPSAPPSLTEKYIHIANFEVDYLLTLKSDIDLNARQAENYQSLYAINSRMQAAILAYDQAGEAAQAFEAYDQACNNDQLLYAINSRIQACSNDQLYHLVNL